MPKRIPEEQLKVVINARLGGMSWKDIKTRYNVSPMSAMIYARKNKIDLSQAKGSHRIKVEIAEPSSRRDIIESRFFLRALEMRMKGDFRPAWEIAWEIKESDV